MSEVAIIGWPAEKGAALAAALAGYGYGAAGAQAAAPLAALLPAGFAAARPPRGTALVVLGEGPSPAAGEDVHTLPLPLRLGALIALLRRLEQRRALDRPGAEVGPYRFHTEDRLLLHRQTGEITRLTDKETALLAALVAAGGAAVPRERLLEDVWGYGALVTTHTLETHIYRLRQKLGGDEAAAALLPQSEAGYRLAVEAPGGPSASGPPVSGPPVSG